MRVDSRGEIFLNKEDYMERLPSDEKIEWMAANVPESEKNEMIRDLLKAIKTACETSNGDVLLEILEDWEATIEAHASPEIKKALENAMPGVGIIV